MRVREFFAVLIAMSALAGCSNPEERYEAGYSDGYVVGYNEVCHPRTTNLIEGDFDNSDYQDGYEAGHAEGMRACRERR